ncbi:hypothetical protein [Desulfomonile tiedjei]|uniref:NERD domain-containing protein n=1 Tax=Desulfomonile tiedjei (strain ATCC 49306 / DSM 6799 / DCB-1) TaxID=706587 RepID=I4C5K3_DESTA|nr:hypothetical protein [Desulfomonile tiedjei]AFM24844.1 hypothetical protein Desti_2146 [Desulfomonile tiedjei DSM 6799]
MTTQRVDTFTFEFPDSWLTIKYDDCVFYRNRFGQLVDVKAVDVLAIGHGLFIIEAKDFRRYRIQSKQRMSNDELVLEIAKKVRDTVAVLYGAYRHENQELSEFCSYLYSQTVRPIKVILLLEEDRPPTGHKSFKRIRPNLLTAINQRLRYLNVHCNLHNCSDVPGNYGWTVR